MTDEEEGEESSMKFLDTVEGEIAFFRSMMRARPVGLHRHFHVLTIRNAILRDTGRLVSTSALWRKARSCYDLDILESIEVEGYDPPGEHDVPSPSTNPVRSPSPSANLSIHPFFRHEYTLPQEEMLDRLISSRRMRASASVPSSSPAPSSAPTNPSGRSNKKGRSKLKDMAGLIGGDSDSSALTQESGDESAHATPRDSAVAGTDAGTDFAEEEEVDGSPSPSLASRANKKPVKTGRRGSSIGRGRGGSTGRGRGSKRGKR